MTQRLELDYENTEKKVSVKRVWKPCLLALRPPIVRCGHLPVPENTHAGTNGEAKRNQRFISSWPEASEPRSQNRRFKGSGYSSALENGVLSLLVLRSRVQCREWYSSSIPSKGAAIQSASTIGRPRTSHSLSHSEVLSSSAGRVLRIYQPAVVLRGLGDTASTQKVVRSRDSCLSHRFPLTASMIKIKWKQRSSSRRRTPTNYSRRLLYHTRLFMRNRKRQNGE
jgi:hypothetical protein